MRILIWPPLLKVPLNKLHVGISKTRVLVHTNILVFKIRKRIRNIDKDQILRMFIFDFFVLDFSQCKTSLAEPSHFKVWDKNTTHLVASIYANDFFMRCNKNHCLFAFFQH